MKKQWVTIAVSGLALGASLIGVGVSADEQATNQVTSASTPESVSQDPDLVVTETTVATTKADQGATNKASDTTAKQPVLKKTKQVALTICLVAKRELLLQLQKQLTQSLM